MSHIKSPTNVLETNQQQQQTIIINNRDRLLRLAELGTSSSNNKNVKQNKRNNSKQKLRIPSLSLERNNNNYKSPNLTDLSFTNNIEHLVNNSNSKNNNKSSKKGDKSKKKNVIISNLDDDDVDDNHDEQKFFINNENNQRYRSNNRWKSIHSSSSSRDSSQEHSIYPLLPAACITLTKSVLNNHNHDDGNIQPPPSSTSLTTDKYFRNESSTIVSRIPLFNGHYTEHDHFIHDIHHTFNNDNPCSDLYAKYHEFRRKNLRQFSSCKDHHYERPSLLRMQSDLQPSSLSSSSSGAMLSTVLLKSNNVKYIPIQRDNNESNSKTFESNHIPSIATSLDSKVHDQESDFVVVDNIKSTKTINHPNNDGDNKILFNQRQAFVVLDEDHGCPNTPKKISTSTPKKDESELGQQQLQQQQINTQKVLFSKVDLFNCDQYPPLEMTNKKQTVVESNQTFNAHDLLGQLFLADSQKNSMLSMITAENLNNENYNNKSSSCDKLDSLQSFQLLSTDKHRSENDLSKNDISGLGHLEEQPEHHNGMIDRFKKKFSLRASKSAGNSPKHDKINNNDQPTNNRKSLSPPLNNYNVSEIDINQNKIDLESIENFKYLHHVLNGKHSPSESKRRQFMSINRKSLRKISRKHGRLKRSHTQPFNDNDLDDMERMKLVMNANEDPEIFTTTDKSLVTMNGANNNIIIDDDNHTRNVIYAEAIFDYQGNDNEELSFHAGDLIEVSDTSHKQWWWGTIKATTLSSKTSQPKSNTTATPCDEIRHGWIPASYVRLKVSQEETIEESLQNATDQQSSLINNNHHSDNYDNNGVDNNNDMSPTSLTTSQISMRTNITTSKLMSAEQVRANVVLEILNTEKDFVKNLKDVIDGYLKPCRDRNDMFDSTRIATIFGNIEELYEFQSKFLQQLEHCVDMKNLAASCIGHCFLENENGFDCYSDFCKNHPLATSELQDLYIDHKYVIFFEGCRLLQNMIDISLDGFLLTPIQKICKYPLQLAELLKYTKPEHSDYMAVAEAYQCMQRVAQLVNERKSRFESLEKLLSLQESFENWDGPPLLDKSSILIHSGEITRITRTTWSKELTLFIFDHLLIMAKKDSRLLKKRAYLFKTRIELDHIDPIISLDDNIKDGHFNVLAKNAFKFYYHPKQKWYLFQAKSAEDKDVWLKAFERERQRCHDDELQGFRVTEQDKKGARLAHENHLKPKKPKQLYHNIRKPYAPKISRKPDTVIAEIPLGPIKGFEIDRYNRAGSLPSYIHQEKHLINNNNANNLLYNNHHHHHHHKNRQSTMHKKSTRSNWFQFGNNNNVITNNGDNVKNRKLNKY
ncbi:Rho guanine nucleotide exchange factor 4 [Dermatophagoides farinae]|uniref:Rho guanine nucleotide exchange factor 4 n=1 Tax=Dermatophagoides farinae TaxID=6954 RepID=A0A922I5Z1_DERFA|nr:Rho guanine nucleotide exchange factor 4 [Dermatophagoides farinae]